MNSVTSVVEEELRLTVVNKKKFLDDGVLPNISRMLAFMLLTYRYQSLFNQILQAEAL